MSFDSARETEFNSRILSIRNSSAQYSAFEFLGLTPPVQDDAELVKKQSYEDNIMRDDETKGKAIISFSNLSNSNDNISVQDEKLLTNSTIENKEIPTISLQHSINDSYESNFSSSMMFGLEVAALKYNIFEDKMSLLNVNNGTNLVQPGKIEKNETIDNKDFYIDNSFTLAETKYIISEQSNLTNESVILRGIENDYNNDNIVTKETNKTTPTYSLDDEHDFARKKRTKGTSPLGISLIAGAFFSILLITSVFILFKSKKQHRNKRKIEEIENNSVGDSSGIDYDSSNYNADDEFEIDEVLECGIDDKNEVELVWNGERDEASI